MITIDSREVPPKEMARRIREMRDTFFDKAESEFRISAANIEGKSKILTPVDTGLMRGRTEGIVRAERRHLSLRIENRALYSPYQHEREDYRHTVGQAKFIEIPFRAEVPQLLNRLMDLIDREMTS